MRSAASYATGEMHLQTDSGMMSNMTHIGNIAIGNLHLFLPTIVKLVQHDEERRLLALHALKEVR